MKTPDKKKLLSELFAEPDDLAHRRQSHAAFLREVRRRKALRLTRSIVAVAAAIVVLGILLLQFRPAPTPLTPFGQVTAPPPPYELVHSSPASVDYVTTPALEIAVIHTTGTVERINDAELLALFEGRSLALVTLEAGRKSLRFFE